MKSSQYHVKRIGESWTVQEYLYDNDPSGMPRVTVMSVHPTRSEAIDAARVLAGDSVYYVDDVPSTDAIEPATEATHGTYQSNYKESRGNSGDEVVVTDGDAVYAYDLTSGDTLRDVLDSFAETYDLGESDEVVIRAEQYRDGVLIDTCSDTLGAERR